MLVNLTNTVENSKVSLSNLTSDFENLKYYNEKNMHHYDTVNDRKNIIMSYAIYLSKLYNKTKKKDFSDMSLQLNNVTFSID